jgi:hypothetical protein
VLIPAAKRPDSTVIAATQAERADDDRQWNPTANIYQIGKHHITARMYN